LIMHLASLVYQTQPNHTQSPSFVPVQNGLRFVDAYVATRFGAQIQKCGEFVADMCDKAQGVVGKFVVVSKFVADTAGVVDAVRAVFPETFSAATRCDAVVAEVRDVVVEKAPAAEVTEEELAQVKLATVADHLHRAASVFDTLTAAMVHLSYKETDVHTLDILSLWINQLALHNGEHKSTDGSGLLCRKLNFSGTTVIGVAVVPPAAYLDLPADQDQFYIHFSITAQEIANMSKLLSFDDNLPAYTPIVFCGYPSQLPHAISQGRYVVVPMAPSLGQLPQVYMAVFGFGSVICLQPLPKRYKLWLSVGDALLPAVVNTATRDANMTAIHLRVNTPTGINPLTGRSYVMRHDSLHELITSLLANSSRVHNEDMPVILTSYNVADWLCRVLHRATYQRLTVSASEVEVFLWYITDFLRCLKRNGGQIRFNKGSFSARQGLSPWASGCQYTRDGFGVMQRDIRVCAIALAYWAYHSEKQPVAKSALWRRDDDSGESSD